MRRFILSELACLLFTITLSVSSVMAVTNFTEKSFAKENVVQVDVSTLLNTRPVTTLTAGKLITWTKGVDGGGKGNGYLTMSASLAVGDKEPKALPDNPLIPASGSRPEMLLHYSNDDAEGSQACVVTTNKEVVIATPAKKFRQMLLAWTSSEGG